MTEAEFAAEPGTVEPGTVEPGASAPGPWLGRVHLATFGCRANQYDTERFRQELEGDGWRVVEDPAEASAVVINTCTVTARADSDAARLIRRLQREQPGRPVVVAGCSAARYPERYRQAVGEAAVVAGHDPIQVRDAVRSMAGRPRPAPSASGVTSLPAALRAMPAALTSLTLGRLSGGSSSVSVLERRVAGTRGWLKIQDGCDRKCSFCATRLARGASRSRDPEAILAEARQLAIHHPELALTGIHIGHYGRDLPEAMTLGELVARLVDEVPEVRFRLGSVEATEVEDGLLGVLERASRRDGARLAPHLHMPLQSGADPVLRRMRRWHTRDDYRRRALTIAEALPVLGLGADVITGFPGETDADHRDTVRLVEELPFTYLHVFPFSPREGTVAAELARENPVPQRVAAERARELRELGQAKGEAYLASRVGSRVEVVVERERPDGTALGLTEDYLRLPVEGVQGEGGGGPRLWPGVINRDGERFFVRGVPV
jgi:threonylcarbamoyladenosine tRNA methylthiotransferase MtaB